MALKRKAFAILTSMMGTSSVAQSTSAGRIIAAGATGRAS